MYKLFIDDLRDAEKYYPGEGFIVVRSCGDAISYVQSHGLPQFVSFDHDLGDTESEVEQTGYTFAKYLIEYMFDNNIKEPFQYYVHSANPVGLKNIVSYLENGFKHL